MARNRQRAKQRQQRRTGKGPVPGEAPTHHENVPGSLEHASGDIEEFDARLVAGAGGESVDAAAPDGEPAAARSQRAPAGGAGSDRGETEPAGEQDEPLPDRSRPRSEAPREGSRVMAFLRASWAELQRVQWPDRREVGQATAVVLGFVAIAGSYLGLADFVASRVVNAIL